VAGTGQGNQLIASPEALDSAIGNSAIASIKSSRGAERAGLGVHDDGPRKIERAFFLAKRAEAYAWSVNALNAGESE
jgi:hypothetical protein